MTALALVGKTKWTRLNRKWRESFPLDPLHPSLGSWLDVQLAPWGVFCKACRAAAVNPPVWSSLQVLQSCNFSRHASSKQHRAAVRCFLEKTSTDSGENILARAQTCIGAPSEEEFQNLLNNIRDGKATCGSRKESKMTFCVAESMKSVDQKFIRKAQAIALYRDERNGRIAVRFKAVARDLTVHSGTLGQEREAGTGARNITVATYRIMKRACSRFCLPPAPSKSPAVLKKQLLQHLRTTVTSVTVDSAADEVLSAELMRSSVLNASQKELTPNLRFVLRDRAHSSRRITSRPWHADTVLKEVLDFMCIGRGSIAKLVQFSPEIRRVFGNYAHSSDSAVKTAVTNMRAAGHRFESHSKPLGRTCLFLHACIRTALHLTRSRSDKAARVAMSWLQWLSEERALLAAMLADAADSSLGLTRVLDAEELDPARLSAEIGHFLAGIKALFNGGQCLHTFGYTRTMLALLKKPIVLQIGSKTKCFGCADGVSDAVQKACLGRLQAWVKLAESTIASEFPCFEVAQAPRSVSRLSVVGLGNLNPFTFRIKLPTIYNRFNIMTKPKLSGPAPTTHD